MPIVLKLWQFGHTISNIVIEYLHRRQKENPKTVLACLQWTQIECFKQTNKGQHSSDTVPVSSAQKQV